MKLYLSFLVCSASFAAACLNLQAQTAVGTVLFGNDSSTRLFNGQTGQPVTTNDNVQAALFWAPLNSTNFVQLGPTMTNVGVPLPGIFLGGTRATSLKSAGEAAGQFQVRAWSGGFPTFEEAKRTAGALLGQSAILEGATGNPAGDPPTPPPSLVSLGLQSFTLTTWNGAPLQLNGAGPQTVRCGSTWDFEAPTASGGCSNVQVEVLDTETNGTCPQVITRRWLATDSCSNSTTYSQAVTVVDTKPPSLVCGPDKTVECAAAWDFDAPMAQSECNATGVSFGVLSTVTNGSCGQVITRTWWAADGCGNSNTCSQSVTVACPGFGSPALLVSRECPAYPVPGGGLLSFSGSVTNAGSIVLTNVVVVNEHPSTNHLLLGPISLAPGESASFSGSYRVEACSCGPHADNLTASGTSPCGLTVATTVSVSCPGTDALPAPGDLSGDGIVDQSELFLVLSNYFAHGPWVYMTNAANLGGGVFQFGITNTSGWTFSVLSSEDMKNWTPLPSQAFPVFQFLDPAATNSPQRFYRLRWP